MYEAFLLHNITKPNRWQSKTLSTIDERGSKPLLSVFVDSININFSIATYPVWLLKM